MEGQFYTIPKSEWDSLQHTLQELRTILNKKADTTYMTQEEAMKYMRVKSPKAMKTRRDRGLRFTMESGSYLYTKEDVEQYLQERTFSA